MLSKEGTREAQSDPGSGIGCLELIAWGVLALYASLAGWPTSRVLLWLIALLPVWLLTSEYRRLFRERKFWLVYTLLLAGHAAFVHRLWQSGVQLTYAKTLLLMAVEAGVLVLTVEFLFPGKTPHRLVRRKKKGPMVSTGP